VLLSGQVAWDEPARVVGSTYAEQTRNAFANLDLALEDAGSDLQHVLHIRVYVRGEVAEHLAELPPILAERLRWRYYLRSGWTAATTPVF
jgi:2-iminobutanoate/2-iminopropanoate deaminase